MKDKIETEDYWTKRYIDQSTGWDLGEVSPPIKSYIDQLKDKTIKILIPGAGNAYEAEYLYKMGFTNTYIIDISKIPLISFKNRVPNFPEEQIINGDFFELNDQFDLIIEQTFFCSFPPVNNRTQVVKLPNGQTELLMTSLMDAKTYSNKLFKTLYFKRWEVETYYDELKNKLKVEHFSGYSNQVILQDFNAALFVSNIQTLIIGELEDEIN